MSNATIPALRRAADAGDHPTAKVAAEDDSVILQIPPAQLREAPVPEQAPASLGSPAGA